MLKKINKIGLPRIIITIFLISLYVLAPFVGVDLKSAFQDTMIQGGTGLNFGMPLGIEAGLLGAVISIELGMTGMTGFVGAILISLPISILFGYGYGAILNKVKGGEMMIATYVGFSSVAFMCIMWLILPFKKEDMIWAYGGEGLRTTISVEAYWNKILGIGFSDFGNFSYLGEIVFFLFLAFLMKEYFKSKDGLGMKAVGANEKFAKSIGVDIDKARIKSVIISTMLAGIGIIVYQQSFGFIQLYLAPFYMAFPAIAAILIGGASIKKAKIINVIIGTILFQGVITMTPVVIGGIIKTDMSETIRVIISNGMILYALTRKGGNSNG
ncbi:MAG: ABC transporter permease subunit [Cetobacterium sp.]